jgi:hypothetical protein
MKLLLKVLAGLAALLVILVVVLYLARNTIATAVVRAAAGRALGVPVEVDAVELDFFEGRATVRGLAVSNPPGFKSPLALKAGEASVDISSDSTSSAVVVDLVGVRDVGIWFEQKGTTNNVSAIIDGLKSGDTAPAEKPAPKAAGPQVSLVIRKLLLERVSVHASESTGLAGDAIPVAVTLDRLEVNDIRTNASGDGLAEQVTSKVFEATMAAVVQQAGNKLPAAIGQGVMDSAKAAGTALEGATKAMGEAGKAIGDAFKGLGDTLGGKKK